MPLAAKPRPLSASQIAHLEQLAGAAIIEDREADPDFGKAMRSLQQRGLAVLHHRVRKGKDGWAITSRGNQALQDIKGNRLPMPTER